MERAANVDYNVDRFHIYGRSKKRATATRRKHAQNLEVRAAGLEKAAIALTMHEGR